MAGVRAPWQAGVAADDEFEVIARELLELEGMLERWDGVDPPALQLATRLSLVEQRIAAYYRLPARQGPPRASLRHRPEPVG